jgi:hypothetical protein
MSPWARMMPLEHDKLLPKCQILEKETVMRAKEANQRSAAESKGTKHAAGYSRIVMKTKTAMLLIPKSAGVLAKNTVRIVARQQDPYVRPSQLGE